MKFTGLMAAASCVAAVSASPLAKREIGGLLLCTGANATGPCEYNVYELGKCHQVKPPFYQNTSTFAPDGEDFACSPRVVNCGEICTSPTGCTFGNVDFAYKHKYDLGAIQWNTLVHSFICTKKTSHTNGVHRERGY